MRSSAGGIAVASNGFGILKGAIAGLGIGNLLNTTRNFEAAMNDVQEKLNLTGQSMEEVRDFALEMGATTAFSASESGSALSELAALGFSAADAMGTLPDVLNLAVGASLSLGESAVITAKSLNQFGLDVDQSTRVVDLLAGSADSSAANVGFLAEVFSKAGPVAASMGVSMEEVAAAAGLLADKGVRAETAGTALRNMFDQLVNPSKATADALAEVGLAAEDFTKTSADGQRQFVGLGAAFDLLKNSGADTPALMKALGREISSLIPVVEAGSIGLEEMAGKTIAAASAQKQAETQAQGLPGAYKAVASAWEALNLSLAGKEGAALAAGALTTLAAGMRFLATDSIPKLQPAIAGLSLRFRSARVAFLAFREAMASGDTFPFVAMREMGNQIQRLGGFLAPIVPYLDEMAIAMVAVTAASAVFGVLAGAVGLLASPLVLIAAFATSVYAIYDNWDGVVAWWSDTWGAIQATSETFLVWWRDTDFDQKVADIDASAIEFVRETAGDFFNWWDSSELKTATPKVIVDGIDRAREAGTQFLNWWEGTTFEERIIPIQYAAVDLAREAVGRVAAFWNETTFVEKLLIVPTTQIDLASKAGRAFVDWWDTTTLKPYLPTVLVDSIDSAIETISGFVDYWNNTTLKGIAADITFELVTKAWETIRGFVDYWEKLDLKSIILDFEFPTFESITSGSSGLLDKMRGFGGDIVGGIGDGIARAKDHINGVEKVKDEIETTIAQLPSDMTSVGTDVINGLAVGIESGQAGALQAANDASTGILSRFKQAFETQSPSKATARIGVDVASGLAVGINSGSGDAIEAARVLSQGVLTTFDGLGGAANGRQPFATIGAVGTQATAANDDAALISEYTSYQNQRTAITAASEAERAAIEEASRASGFERFINANQENLQIAQNFSNALTGFLTSGADARAEISLAVARTDQDQLKAAEQAFRDSGTEQNRIALEAAQQKAATSEAAARRAFESQKKYAIAQAIVAQGLTIAQAFADPTLHPLAKFGIAAASALQVATAIRGINSAQFDGGSSISAGGGSYSGGTSGGSSVTAAQQPAAQASTANQVTNIYVTSADEIIDKEKLQATYLEIAQNVQNTDQETFEVEGTNQRVVRVVNA